MGGFRTRMTDLLGVSYPVQCGTMQWLSRAELVAAVAEAGGFACLAAATFPDPDDLAAEIEKTRGLTGRPFGVNISLFPTLQPRSIKALIETVIDCGVPVLETAGGNPEPYLARIRSGGLIHLHKCARMKDALKMNDLGVDALALVGTESGGHPGPAGITSMVLLPMAAKRLSVPILAGGGICDGWTLAAALAMGADGAVMGTRFLCTRECPAHDRVKERVLEAAASDTLLVLESMGNPGRVLRTPRAEEVVRRERAGATLKELAPLIRGEASRRALIEGFPDEGLLACGQAAGCMDDIPTVAELMRRIIREAREALRRLDAALGLG